MHVDFGKWRRLESLLSTKSAVRMDRCGHPFDPDWRVLSWQMVYEYHDYNNLELFYFIAVSTRSIIVIKFANQAIDDYLNFNVYVYNQDAFYIETYVYK